MHPLVSVAGSFFPAILDALAGERGAQVAEAARKAVEDKTKSDDPAAAKTALEASPELLSQLQLVLAGIVQSDRQAMRAAEAEALKTAAEAAEAKRKGELEGFLAAHKAKLESVAQDQSNLLSLIKEEQKSTESSREQQRRLIESRSPIGYVPATLSMIVVIGFFVVLALFLFMKNSLERVEPPKFPPEVVGILRTLEPGQIAALVSPRSDFVIQIINICIGALAAAFATVISFWLGSSQSSRSKDVLVADLQEQSARNQERQAKDNVEMARMIVGGGTAPAEPPAVPRQPADAAGQGGAAASTPQQDAQGRTPPVKPAPAGLVREILPELTHPHRHFPNSVAWALTAGGVAIDGAAAKGTPGAPTTVRSIWEKFGPLCAAASQQFGVPVELIVATIATESGGDPRARRPEPQIDDVSVGLMQTLVRTARSAIGRPNLTADDLLDPRLSIEAGAAYIASQRASTHFDPPLVAAAYNAGSLKPDNADANRWKLHCFPRGTGAHIDKFVAWFADAMNVSDDDDWSAPSGCPSFAAVLRGAEGAAAPADTTSRDFPPRPGFGPLISHADKQAVFGAFSFVHRPVKGNPENIDILGDWEARNIVDVAIPLKSFLGKAGPLKMRFHRLGEQQLVALWLEWEKAGLLSRILSYDGAFVPRFQRGSTSKLSNHAFGTAFDINAATNGLGAEPALVGQKGSVRELVEAANRHGFYWGGHFRSRPDGMHFEVARIL